LLKCCAVAVQLDSYKQPGMLVELTKNSHHLNKLQLKKISKHPELVFN